ncbi:MAG: EFR1 family ferrodoxin [Oscillospiraceae bacterium]|nr:EFR1 family ferrodoxin [Oscillospiraceae bacterium]
MIFYFTGTGNSLYAAKKLADEDEEIVSIVEALHSKSFHYVLKEGEKLGFVFPVYFYTVSDPVLELVRNLTVENAGFVYAVIPCGASIGTAGGFLKSELNNRGLDLQRVDALVVPDGALIFYNIDPPEKMEKTLEAATKELASIKQAIDRHEGNNIKGSPTLGKIWLTAYHACMGTKPFHADEKCIGCGKCASICPAGTIEMVDGRPAWTKNKCLKCCGCINRCPVSAIQYGKRTDNRGRYVNPILK